MNKEEKKEEKFPHTEPDPYKHLEELEKCLSEAIERLMKRDLMGTALGYQVSQALNQAHLVRKDLIKLEEE